MVLMLQTSSFPGLMRSIALIVVIVMLRTTLSAQISPGELHRAHASLEGVENCTKCHGVKRELVADKCLACHTAIAQRLQTGTGLHGKQSYRECQTCHVEHQGRDFSLIYWKGGRDTFDHSFTGYTLDGKHAGLDCRKCHTGNFLSDTAAITKDHVNRDSTFLGLSAVCSSCHTDEHRGQLTAACSTCHTTSAWKPATGFDHAKAKYTLDGKHLNVACAKCHAQVVDHRAPADSSFSKFTGLQFGNCTSCHADFHKGKLGDNCQNCHSTSGWHVTDKAKFDHGKTRYPLEGIHSVIACDKCHSPGKERASLKFANCRDCHADYHKGEFAKRESKGACEECHTVSGFAPAKFLMSQHDQSAYPLKGSHRAVPCDACHLSKTSPGASVAFQFRFSTTRCVDCHSDPHRGEVNKFVSQSGCDFCHTLDSWRTVKFDHNVTKFALTDKHQTVACKKCHLGILTSTGDTVLAMALAKPDCWSCHTDPHRAQFAKAGEENTDCNLCHTPANWKANKFDHNVLTRFKLDGAHKNVPCSKCHRPTTVDGALFVAYKPLDTTCVSCHGGIIPNIQENNK